MDRRKELLEPVFAETVRFPLQSAFLSKGLSAYRIDLSVFNIFRELG